MIDEAWAGSSPLTRGKHAVMAANPIGLGLIPAHAGKTENKQLIIETLAAHPRSRGENWCKPVARGLSAGSSPLTRGKQAQKG